MNVSIPYDTFRNEIYLPSCQFVTELESFFSKLPPDFPIPEGIRVQLNSFLRDVKKELSSLHSVLSVPSRRGTELRLEMSQYEWSRWVVIENSIEALQRQIKIAQEAASC